MSNLWYNYSYWDYYTFFFYIFVMFFTGVLAFIGQNSRRLIGLNRSVQQHEGNNINKVFFIGIAFLLVFISGFRVTNGKVGIDTANYEEIFKSVQSGELKVFSLKNIITLNQVEPGYLLLNKIIGFFTNNAQFLFVTCSTITIVFILIAALQKKDNISIPQILMIYCSSFFIQSFNLVRLYLAVSIIIYAYSYIEKRKIFKYTTLVLLAASFHFTALIVWPVYFFWNKNNFKFKNIIYFLIIAVFIYKFNDIFNIYFSNTKYSYYDNTLNENSHGIGLYLIKSPLLLIAFILRKPLAKVDKANDLYINILIFDFLLTPLSYSFNIFGRISSYFSIIEIFLIPSFAQISRKKNYTQIFNFLIYLCILVKYIYYIQAYWNVDAIMPYQNILFNSLFD